MPKQRITKEMVVEAAFEIARSDGMEAVMVKTIAENLECSVQPIYSYCKNMEGLRNDVSERARIFIQEYIQIAREEPHIFKMFIFQERKGICSLDDLYLVETSPMIAKEIAENMNISMETARQLHLNMLIYTIGLGTIFSVTSSGIAADEIFSQQEIAYQVFLKSALGENENE